MKRITKGARDRAYRVAMHALAEENRVCKLTDEELSRRMREIWESCYDPEANSRL
jgi:hypothetical protein